MVKQLSEVAVTTFSTRSLGTLRDTYGLYMSESERYYRKTGESLPGAPHHTCVVPLYPVRLKSGMGCANRTQPPHARLEQEETLNIHQNPRRTRDSPTRYPAYGTTDTTRTAP